MFFYNIYNATPATPATPILSSVEITPHFQNLKPKKKTPPQV